MNRSYETLSSPKGVTVDDKLISRKVLILWNDKGAEDKRPDKVKLTLCKDGKPYSTHTVSAEDAWSYTWDSLDNRFEWSVIEDVPTDYSVSYDRHGITFTVTNSREAVPSPSPTPSSPTLPQTGQLWWPVPVLLCLGLVFILIGLVQCRSRYHE